MNRDEISRLYANLIRASAECGIGRLDEAGEKIDEAIVIVCRELPAHEAKEIARSITNDVIAEDLSRIGASNEEIEQLAGRDALRNLQSRQGETPARRRLKEKLPKLSRR